MFKVFLIWLALAGPAGTDPITVTVALLANGVAFGAALQAVFGVVGAFVIQLGGSLLLSRVAAALGRARGPDQARELANPNSRPPYRFGYGDKPVDVSWVPIRTKDTKYIYGCVLVNSRPSEEVTGLIFDTRPTTFVGDQYDFTGPGADVADAPMAGYVKAWVGLGDQTTVPATILAEASEFFQATDVWQGRTIIWLRIQNGPSKSRSTRWPAFPPAIKAVGKWSKVWDPADEAQDPDDPDTWTWSANQGRCLLDLMRQNPIETYEMANLHLDSFLMQCALSDERVDLLAGGDEARYEAHGLVIFDGSEFAELARPLEEAGACRAFSVGGQRGVIPGGPRDSIYTITDVIGTEMEFVSLIPGRDLPNVGRFSYLSVARGGEMAELQPYYIPGALAADGGKERFLEVELTMVASPPQAMRIRKIMCGLARAQAGLTGTFPPDAIDLVTGSVATAALPAPFDVFNGGYEVVTAAPATDMTGESGVSMRVPCKMQEYDATIFEWDIEEEEEVAIEDYDPTPPGTEAPGLVDVTTGPGVDTTANGVSTPRIRFAFDPIGSPVSYEWQIREGAGDWEPGGAIDGDIRDGSDQVFGYTGSLSAGQTYRIRARSVSERFQGSEGNLVLAYSDWIESADATTVDDDFDLGIPTDGAAVGGAAQISVSFTTPNSADFVSLEIHVSNTDDSGAATLLVNIFSAANTVRTHVHSGLGAAETRFYFARSRGPANTVSAFTASVTATTDP